MFTALLDTCVLWPSLQRDFLLSLAIEGHYRPAWSGVILEELAHHEAVKLVDRGMADTEARRRARTFIIAMQRAFNDAEVTGWEGLEGTYGLPDRDDEHVVAAAVVAGAGVIITENHRDFPRTHLPGDLAVLSPRRFCADRVATGPSRAMSAVAAIASRAAGPPLSVDDVLKTLESRYGLREAVDMLRDGC